MNTKNTAILVVEFQKTWTQDSFFHMLIKKQYRSRNVYTKSIQLLETARRNGIPIIQSPFIIDKNNRNTYKKIPFLPKYLGQFVAGTWRAEYTDGINKESDYEVKGRTAFDNTVNSNLIDILKTINAKTIYLMGFTTDHCVAETMDSLIKLGYNAIFVNDATATIFESTQLKMEKKYPNIISTKLIEKFNEGPH